MKRILFTLFALILCFSAFACRPVFQNTHDDIESSNETMEIIVFATGDSGSADAILLRSDTAYVLIDTGLKGTAKKLSARLTELGVTDIDCMILSHFDKDHMGGAAQICADFTVAQIYMPDYEPDEKRYRNMLEAFDETQTPYIRVSTPLDITVADFALSFSPSTLTYDGKDGSDNTQSLVCGISYGESRLLFPGDAEDEWLHALCFGTYNLSCDFLKLPHHGVWDADLISLLTFSLPDIVVVTDAKKDPAEAQTEILLNSMGMESYYSKDGELRFLVDRNGNIEYQN